MQNSLSTREVEAEVGSLLFSAQYQQRPVPVEGNLIRRSWFLAYDNLPASPSWTRIVQSWDVAIMTGGQNDYSACTTWLTHQNDAYLLHVYRGRLEYPELRRKVIGLAAEHRATTWHGSIHLPGDLEEASGAAPSQRSLLKSSLFLKAVAAEL